MAHIILWDDDEIVRRTITVMLESDGHRVTDCLDRELAEIQESDPGI